MCSTACNNDNIGKGHTSYLTSGPKIISYMKSRAEGQNERRESNIPTQGRKCGGVGGGTPPDICFSRSLIE